MRLLLAWRTPAPRPLHQRKEDDMETNGRLAPLIAVFGASTLLAGAASAQAAKPSTHAAVDAKLRAEAKVSETTARATALEEVPHGVVQSSELEREGGKLIYSFDIEVPGKSGIEEVNVNAVTGALEAHEHETPAKEKEEAAMERREAATPKKHTTKP